MELSLAGRSGRTGLGALHAAERARLFQPPVTPASQPRLETRDGAYELKFLLPEAQVENVVAWARERLPADPYADASTDETYRIHSVYLDTADLAVYRRRPGFRSSKLRLRRYGTEEIVYLEEKRKHRGWVSKVRTLVTAAELPLLQSPAPPDGWAGAWFRQALEERQLAPCCQVVYRRLAREGEADGAPVRLTIDRDLRCSRAPGLVPCPENEPQLPIPLTILELKYRDRLPRRFRELVHTFGLAPDPESKYRRAAEACVPVWGLDAR
jgi:hypothetical protein